MYSPYDIIAQMKIPLPKRATGSHLYRYSSAEHLDRLKPIILDHELYLPSLTQLNDPADGRPKLKPMSEEQMFSFLYEDVVRRNPFLTGSALEKEAAIIRYNIRFHGTEMLQQIMASLLNNELAGYRIYSLSKRHDNIVLWGTYAGSHTGYCLEFANEGPLFKFANEVAYGEFEVGLDDPELRNGLFFFCKTQPWSYEEEVRLVLARGKGSKVKIDSRWLTRLILGKNMSDENRALVRQWAEERTPTLEVVTAGYDDLRQMITLSPA